MAQETAGKRPRDNLELDVMDGERLGYGCHYGNFKADHPRTKALNEARLNPKKKAVTSKAEKGRPRVTPEYERVCPVCGQKFTANHSRRIYCSEKCKARAVRVRKKEAAAS